MSIQFSSSANGSRAGGLGGGVHLMARNVVSADDTHTDGLYWLRPFDLAACGDDGAAVSAANGGNRYAWLWSSDHYDPTTAGWARGGGIHLAYSNDVALPPKCGTEIIAHAFTLTNNYTQLETPWLLWVDEDASFPWRLYGHAVNTSTNRQNTVVYRSADFVTWEMVGVSHLADNGGHAGYQMVFRDGANDYWSFGLNGGTVNATAIWTSTDAATFTKDADRAPGILYGTGPSFLIGAQRYIIGKEDATGVADEGVFVALQPIDVNYVDNGDITRLSTMLGSLTFDEYPGPKYLQSVDYTIEDGIAHIFPKRGFFADTALVAAAEYDAGGGYDNQICDYYRYIIDSAAARISAPAGVRAAANGGVVTLQWYNALPQNTYRVYRDTDAGLGTKTLIGDVSGTYLANTPGGVGTYYYQVVTLDNGTERQARVVSPYVSSKSSLVNEHVTRVVADGGDPATIDLNHVEWAEDVLDELGVKDDIAYWVMPELGHIKDGSNVLSKVYCLGSTIHPRGGDLTFATSSTVYNATAWDSKPAWTASVLTAFGRFGSGRLNNIRRARNSGLTLIAGIQRSHTNPITPFGWGEQTLSCFLQVGSGSPGAVTMSFQNTSDTHSTTIANSAPHIIGAVITSSLIRTSVEGSLSSGTARPATTNITDRLNGQRASGGNNSFLLGYGSAGVKMTGAESSATRTYSFLNNQAQMDCRHLIAIRRALNDTQMATLNTRLRAGP